MIEADRFDMCYSQSRLENFQTLSCIIDGILVQKQIPGLFLIFVGTPCFDIEYFHPNGFFGYLLFFKGFLRACSGLLDLTLHNPPSYDYPYLHLLIVIVFHPALLSCLSPWHILPEFLHGSQLRVRVGRRFLTGGVRQADDHRVKNYRGPGGRCSSKYLVISIRRWTGVPLPSRKPWSRLG